MTKALSTGYRHPRESGGPEPAPGLNRGQPQWPWPLDSRFRAGMSGEKSRVHPAAKFTSDRQLFNPLPPPAGGEGRVRGADEAVCGVTHLTLPGAVAPRPLPLPLNGGEGLFPVNLRLRGTASVQSVPIPRTALRFRGNDD
jgi:hypothetical protein